MKTPKMTDHIDDWQRWADSMVAYTDETGEVDEDIVDELAKVKSKIKFYETRERALKKALEEISESTGRDEFIGYSHSVKISSAERKQVSSTVIKEELGADWFNAHCSVSRYYVVRTTELDEAKKREAA